MTAMFFAQTVHPLLYAAALGEVEPEPVLDVTDDDVLFPEPCAMCGAPASPYVETLAGPLCFACADGPEAPPPVRATVRDLRLRLTCQRIACARASRQFAGVV